LALTPELYDLIVRIVDDRVRDVKVAREEYERLRESIAKLAEAQRRTEERLERLAERVEELTEAQRLTEQRLSALAKRLEQLAEAQRATEHRLEALAEAQRRTEERLEALAEAQRRTEQRLEELAAAQSRTEERLEKLAEAQSRTEERLEKLIAALDSLRVEVGRLSDAVGFGLEDIARVVLPGWLHRSLGVEVDELRREFITIGGREVEVDIYGEGRLKGERVVVVGEVKSRISESDVRRFYERVYAPASEDLGVRVVGVLFGYLVHPSARRRARELGLHVVASYGA